MVTSSRLYKSANDKIFFGVSGGLAEYFDVDPALVRVAFICLCFLAGAGFLLYLVLALVMPTGAVVDADRGAGQMGDGEAQEGVIGRADIANRRRNTFGLGLVIAGVIILFVNIGALSWFRWDLFWPLALVALGTAILANRGRRA
jgi:phage shock protein C